MHADQGRGQPSPASAAAPALSLPKGGGAIRGMGEKFGANPATGTGTLRVPIAASPSRAGLTPQLALSYDSGAGNGPFGFGWSLELPAISRKTERGLPQYLDATDSDVFLLSGAEDLLPVFAQDAAGAWVLSDGRHAFAEETRAAGGSTYRVRRYRPRVEGLFARIERWTSLTDPVEVHWRSISRDNLLTIYGQSAESRIADPSDPRRIFSWLICETRDDSGNAILYEYAPEDGAKVDLTQSHERNRGPAADPRRSANRYLRRIRYGNRSPLLDDAGRRPAFLTDQQRASAGWMFELVLDYDQGYILSETLETEQQAFVQASATSTQEWSVRPDSFSSYRAGFELRTCRLCRRVLLFHHFPDEPGVGADCLVRSTDFSYAETENSNSARAPVYSFLSMVSQSGYVRRGDGYLRRSLPPLVFGYTQPTVQDTVHELDAASLEGLPIGVDGSAYQLVDLHGEGLVGILSQQPGAWFYKRNLSPISPQPAAFGPWERVALMPSLDPDVGQAQPMDLAGDGLLDMVLLSGPAPGLFEHDEAEGWQPFRPFSARITRDLRDPNLRLLDLDGDGRADLLISEADGLVWHPGLGEAGFGPAQRLPLARDEERGPRLLFAEGSGCYFIADLSGDGLGDLARIRNGEICYWPNLGYGRFGAKVTMDNPPLFDHPDRFDPRRLRLLDSDGSGTADLCYLHPDGVRLYFNQSGNSWSQPRTLPAFPRLDDSATIIVADLRGNGTACLVWSSPLAGDAGRQLRYLELMGGQKPHLLVSVANNLGAETTIHYAPSTRFYLQDRAAGKPWISRLPFPVHVVERVESLDRMGGNRFVSRYAYHHGYFDGEEREFRGFGMVEQWDTEELAALSADGSLPAAANLDPASHVPPVLTRSWYHTGVYLGRQQIADYFRGEYYREPGLELNDGATHALLLDDTVLPAGLTDAEAREACRALKGMLLRQEIYALDGSDKEPHPYLVTEQNFDLRLLQPRGDGRHAVFFAHPREALSCHYERNPADPRLSHALTLKVDDFGNVLRSAAVAYGRRAADAALSLIDQGRQAQIQIIVAEHSFTNPLDQPGDYRTPLPAEAQDYELTGLLPAIGATRLSPEDLHAAIDRAAPIPYQQQAEPGLLQKRLIERQRSLYRPDDLGASVGDSAALLPLHILESRALPGESYRLAFAPGQAEALYGGRVSPALLTDEGGYVELDGDDSWWLPAGRAFLSPGQSDSPADELAEAQAHFFTPRRYRDPFGGETIVDLDRYDLLVAATRDPLGNQVRAEYDYRVLQPRLVTDANGNRSGVAFDALGLVVGSAVMGKASERKGDSLAGFVADLDEARALAHLADPLADPLALLHGASTRIVYDLFAYARSQGQARPQPAVVASLARETHLADLGPNEQARIQHTLVYSDGFGREIQKKALAEPGPLTPGGPPISPRWLCSGWTIFNNKGKPVRQFEPGFSASQRYEFDLRHGVSPIRFYDPLGRVVATLHPNQTYAKVVFDPWRQLSYDGNDTVAARGEQTGDPRSDADTSGYVAAYFQSQPAGWQTWYQQRIGGALGPQEQRAAEQAARHANTPTTVSFDSLGRPYLTLAHNGFEADGAPIQLPTRIELDIEGNQRSVTDALGRTVMRSDYSMLGTAAYTIGMEVGERWTLSDVAGKPIRAWDSRGHTIRSAYDALRRPLRRFVRGDTAQSDPRVRGREICFEQIVYGEAHPDAETHNMRGRVWQADDSAGRITNITYDFKGNLLESSRQLAADYKALPDWSAVVALEAEMFAGSTSYDALNRPLTLTTPDKSVLRPGYSQSGLLERVEAELRGAPTATTFVSAIGYSARGQRERIAYGNGVVTKYAYDPLTFRLTRLSTTHAAAGDLQHLSYTYDPAGNLTHIQDGAQQTIYFSNQRVEPSSDYVYDPLYQLIEASGREHLGQQGGVPNAPSAPDALGGFHSGLAHPGDGNAMGSYSEHYSYDAVGNIERMIHQAASGSWTRTYRYAEASLIEPERASNRLSSTAIGSTEERYRYDLHGNMVSMAHLPAIEWTFLDQLRASSAQAVRAGTAETTYYVYDAAGQRVRKVTERQAAADATPTRKDERLYLGGLEIYRVYAGDGAALSLERETLHLMDGTQRVAMVETRSHRDDGTAAQLMRYQLGNHLGSASLELDEVGQIISYEEYYPYGSTSYQAVDASMKAAAKRYRYTAMERDEETGLQCHGARYYAPWLGRWTACDPVASVNLYTYAANSPIVKFDPDGRHPLVFLLALGAGLGYLAMPTDAHGPTSEEQATKIEPPTLAEAGMQTATYVGGGAAAGALMYEAAVMGPPLLAAAGQRGLGWALTNPSQATALGTAAVGTTAEILTGAELPIGADDLLTDAPRATARLARTGSQWLAAAKVPMSSFQMGTRAFPATLTEALSIVTGVLGKAATKTFPVGPVGRGVHGVTNVSLPSIPSDITFEVVPKSELNVSATYLKGLIEPDSIYRMEDFLHVRISDEVLTSDEAIAAVITHELYEIETLRSIISNNNKGFVSGRELIELTSHKATMYDAYLDEGIPNIHNAANSVGDYYVEVMRGTRQ